jgi:hypothetical protein
LASSKVSNTANQAPTNAQPVRPKRQAHCAAIEASADHCKPPHKPSIKAIVTPNVAPDALPSKYGSAKGLRNKPCAKAPAKPSKAPANQAPKVRGNRISCTMLSCH